MFFLDVIILKPLIVLAGALYPAYSTFKALEEPNGEGPTTMLTYWLVFAVNLTLEELMAFAVKIIPLYYLLKLAFIVWLQAPQTQGAIVIYRRYILPVLKKHAANIDHYLEEGRKHLTSLTNKSNVGRTE